MHNTYGSFNAGPKNGPFTPAATSCMISYHCNHYNCSALIKTTKMLFSRLLLLLAIVSLSVRAATVRNSHKKRCRTADDLGRIPYLSPNSTFHNFGFPLIRNLCGATKLIGFAYDFLGCANASSIEYLYESEPDLRSGKKSSIIIVDPHVMEGMDVASSGSYVINAMYEILHDLGYHSGVRH